jgi:hypothetical protein
LAELGAVQQAAKPHTRCVSVRPADIPNGWCFVQHHVSTVKVIGRPIMKTLKQQCIKPSLLKWGLIFLQLIMFHILDVAHVMNQHS